MSFGTATVDVQLDSTRAESELVALLSRIADSDAVLSIEVDARNVPSEITAAVDAADTNVVVTSDSSEVTSDVTSAVDAADSEVLVTSDSSDVTSDVTAAIDAADTDVVVTSDASEVTSDVTAAVDAADTDVVVTGEASGLTATVTGALDAADTNVLITGDATGVVGSVEAVLAENSPFGPVSVDGQVNPELLTDVGQLAAGLADASDEGRVFGSVLAGLGAAAAAVGLFQLVDAASEAEQSVGAAEAVFGDAAGTIETFGQTSAQAAGLTATAARNLTAQIGALLQGFGFTQEEAAKTSVEIAQLGADLAATFGGSPEEAVQALGSALRGEFDPLERFGISLNVARANLRAVELGLADSEDAVDSNARAQAALSIIMEQSAGAQGQFARELNTTAGQLAVARAAAQEAAAAVGATLAPTFVELLGVITDDVLPALTDLGLTLGPALGDAVSASVPVLSGALNVLIALTPVAETLADVLDAIPDPVLQIVGTFIALRAAAGPLGSIFPLIVRSLGGLGPALALNVSSLGAFRGGLATARDGVSSLAGSITPLTAVLATAAFAFTLYAQQQANAKREAAELEAQADSLREALSSQEGAVEGLGTLFEDLANKGEDLQLQFLNLETPADELFQNAGITAREFAEGLADVNEPIPKLIQSLRDASDSTAVLDTSVENLTAQGLAELQLQAVEVAGQMILAGIATDRWSEANVQAAFAANTAADGSVLLVGALNDLTEEERLAEEAAQAQADAVTEQEEALAQLATTAPNVTLLMTALGEETGRTTDLLAALAIATRDAGLSEQELQVILNELGASGPQAVANLQAVADTIERVRDAGLNTLPSLEDLAGEFDEFSLEGFRDDLEKGLEAIQNFNTNLALIAEQGGPRLAAAAAQLGPQFAGEIAQGIADGRPGVASEIELLLAGIEGAGVDTATLLETRIGPDLATATGQMGTLVTDAFGNAFALDASGQIVQLNADLRDAGPAASFQARELGTTATTGFDDGLDLTTPAQTAVTDLNNTILNSGPGASFQARELGATTTSGFRTGFDPAVPASARIGEAEVRIANAQERMRVAGSRTGGAGASGFGTGVSGMLGAATNATTNAITAISNLDSSASSGGYGVGSSFGSGIVAGIIASSAAVSAAAGAIVNSAIQSAERRAGISSPSRVFARMGTQMTDGLALGLEQGTREVVSAASSVVDQAASVIPSRTGLDPQIAGLLGDFGDPRGPAMLVGGSPIVNVTVNAPGATRDDADTIATATADATALALERRRLTFSARTAS